MALLRLDDVTLCAITSVNLDATVAAMRRCLAQADFADAVLFTDAAIDLPTGLRRVPIERLATSEAYSHFMMRQLGDHVRTGHCLVVQWDGFLTRPDAWDPAFLGFDYIGATWPQFTDEHTVGNGGFSLRSKRLLDALRDPAIAIGHPEDVAICRTNRPLLEQRYAMRFADPETAAHFAYEREKPVPHAFGFHGVFNMIDAIGVRAFWDVYRTLDHRGPIDLDFRRIFRDLGGDAGATGRRLRFLVDVLAARWRRLTRRQRPQAAARAASSPIDAR